MKEKLGNELYDIKRIATFGLMNLSQHARTRMTDRHIDIIELYDMITNSSTYICQHKKTGEYNNKYPRFVLWCKKNKRVIHVVIEKKSKIDYTIITVYEPSEAIFKDNGRYLKKRAVRDRTKLALHS